jgi:hypothetical protein
VLAGDVSAPVDAADRSAQHLPLADGGERDVVGDGLRKLLDRQVIPGEVRIAERSPAGCVGGHAVANGDRSGLDVPLPGGETHE